MQISRIFDLILTGDLNQNKLLDREKRGNALDVWSDLTADLSQNKPYGRPNRGQAIEFLIFFWTGI